MQKLDPALYTVTPATVERLVVELSNTCNLRCKYCHQNKPGFVPDASISEENFETILEYVKKHSIDTMNLVGGGDILMYPAWGEKCKKLLDAGVKLTTTINLGKILEDSEVESLARFYEITASIDTIDRKILSSVRKAVDIRTIMYNMMRIKAEAVRTGNKINWIISAVYSAEIVERLPELARFTVAFGANIFQIQDVMIFNDIVDNVKMVWELTGHEAVSAARATKEAIRIARDNKLIVRVPPEFDERLDKLEQSTPILEKAA